MKCHNPYCFNQLIKRQKKYCSTICCTSDPNYKKSMSNKLIGRIFSDEHKKNKSLAQTGKKNHRYGKHISETNRQKVSLLLLNNKHALGHKHTEATKEKIRLIHTGNKYNVGKKLSEETKSKIKQSLIGKKHTEETKNKMRLSLLRRDKIHYVSKSEKLFLDKIESIFDVKINRQQYFDGRIYDGKYKQYLIEIDSPFWHSSAERKRIDIEKNKIATNNGFLLYRFDVTNISKISKVIEQNYYVLQSMFI